MMLPLWALARSTRPIIVGPWTSELGFEALYWIPWVARQVERYRIDPARLIVLTRGGAGRWYGLHPTQQIELYDYVPPADVRLEAHAAAAAQQSIKQLQVTPWERQLVALIASRQGIRRYHLLHPCRLYRAFEPFWGSMRVGLGPIVPELKFGPLSVGPPPVGLALPESFVAVRWYQRATWPLREELLAWTHAAVKAIATTTPVVILQSPAYLDDHVDFPAPVGAGITVVRAEPWRENLAVQAAVLKRAKAYVGTWGGMAQLAVRLGIPTVAFFDKWQGVSYGHRILTEWLALTQGTPCYVGRPMDVEAVRQAVPMALPVPEPSRGSSS